MIRELEDLPEVSFIDAVTLPDIEAQMVTDYQDKYNELTGKSAELRRADPMTLILYACAVQIYQLYMAVDRAGKQNLLKYAFGGYLDNLGALKGIARNQAQPATVRMRFTLSAPQQAAVGIPEGTRVTDNKYYFATDEYAEIKPGDMTADVDCTALIPGTDSNEILPGAIKTLVDPIPYMDRVENITASADGEDVESDDSLSERIYLAPSRWSTAGPIDAYVYWAKTYNSEISDVKVTSPKPGEVEVAFIMSGGRLPGETTISGLKKYLDDATIRPLTDHLTVKAPTLQDYSIDLTYWINASDASRAATIQLQVAQAIQEFNVWQQESIGRDINQSELIKRVTAAGAKRVVVRSPVFTRIAPTAVGHFAGQTVTYGGLEDD